MRKAHAKKLLSGFLAIVMFLGLVPAAYLPASAESSSGLWEWVEYGSGVALTEYKGGQTDIYIPGKVESSGKTYPVLKLGNELFKDNAQIRSATIADGITEIGASAFEGATELLFVVTPESLTTIGANAFKNCTAFDSVVLYDGVTEIGADAFAGCSELTIFCNYNSTAHRYAVDNGIKWEILNPSAEPEIVEHEGITYHIMNGTAIAVSAEADLDEVEIPAAVTSEAGKSYPVTELRGTFARHETIRNVTLPASVTVIGREAFYYSTLETVVLSESVTTIEGWAFRGCRIKSVTLPDSVISIGGEAFRECNALERVTLPDSVTMIDSGAFNDCPNLVQINIPNKLSTIFSSTFSRCPKLETLIIPQSVNQIWDDAFPAGAILLVYEGSYGHTFAKENNFLYAIYDGVTEPKIVTDNRIRYLIVDGNAIAYRADEDLTTAEIPAQVSAEGKSYPVTELRGTFSGHENLVSVTVPAGVTIIGNETFYNCTALRSVSLPEGVTSIGDRAFWRCWRLERIDIPDSVKTIGTYAFDLCSSLGEITLPAGIGTIGEYAFYRCGAIRAAQLTIPGSLTAIDRGVFEECYWLTNVKIGEGVETICPSAFFSCMKLETIVIPGTVESIAEDSIPTRTVWLVEEGSYAHTFAKENGCLYVIYDGQTEPEILTVNELSYIIIDEKAVAIGAEKNLTDVTVPEKIEAGGTEYTVTELRGTFAGQSSLKSVTLPNSVTLIGGDTFHQCNYLESVNIPDGVTAIGENAFRFCDALEEISLPDSITSIGKQAFQACRRLSKITLPKGVERIETYTFCDCDALAEVRLPEGLKRIDSIAFANCTSLTNIILPSSISTIEYSAFEWCENLKTVVIPKDASELWETSFPGSTIWLVYENSPAHKFAEGSGRLYFVLDRTGNPEIAYGMEIEGTVKYADGTPAPGVTVEILYEDGTVKGKPVTTGQDGTYKITYAEVGGYTIRATDNSGRTGSENISIKRINLFKVFLAGDTNIILKDGYAISGRVTPTEGATVTLTSTDGKVISSVTAANGSYAFNDVPNGDYILKAENQTGAVLKEVRVYNANVVLDLEIPAGSASITGRVEVSQTGKSWALVSLYNSNGVLTAQTRSGETGGFTFSNIPQDDYAIVAETTEMRPDTKKGYDRVYTLTGYAFVSANENKSYDVGTIVLYEEAGGDARISGKVTANGETQDCTVTITNAFRRQVASMTTGNNGKYTFINIPDGVYFITAVTYSFGAGTTVVVVQGGEVYGETDIRVYKSDKVAEHEKDSVLLTDETPQKEDVSKEKAFYDSLSEKERQQLSADYQDRLSELAEVITGSTCVASGAMVQNVGTLISADEIAAGKPVEFELSVKEAEEHEISDGGIQSEADYLQQMIEDAAGNAALAAYYDISLTKDGKPISDIAKQLDTAGKLRITMDIPADCRGYETYSMIHIHNGEPAILTDLDDDPNTITFELDKFSTCALTYSGVTLTEDSPLTLEPSDVKMQLGDTPATVTVTLEEGAGSVLEITATPADKSIVTATVDGNVITLTPAGVGKTTVTVTVSAEGQTAALTDTITVEVTGTADKSALEAAIAKAEAIDVDSVKTSANGSDISPSDKWVTAAVKEALKNARNNARDVASRADATQDEVDAALSALTDALAAWQPRSGTKSSGSTGGNPAPSNPAPSNPAPSNPAPSDPSYQITVSTAPNGAVTVSPASAKAGAEVTITAVPDEGYAVDTVTVTRTDGSEVEVTDDGDGVCTFTMPASNVTVAVTFAAIEEPWVNPFTDTSEGDWFYNEVAYVMQNGLMKGVGGNRFDPYGDTTRGMVMTILARMMGVDTSGGSTWYEKGMAWAVENKVSDGTKPGEPITREQLAVMLYRLSDKPDADVSVLDGYPDGSSIHTWTDFQEAMAWAIENGIIKGTNKGTLEPEKGATRAEAAAILTRFCRNVAGSE